MSPIRKKKLEAEILRSLSNLILQGEVKDPRVFLPSIHRVEITEDLKTATVYITAICNNNERKKLIAGLSSASGYLTSVIGRALKLHTNPRFHFVWDNNYIKSLEVNRLIDESAPKKPIIEEVAEEETEDADSP